MPTFVKSDAEKLSGVIAYKTETTTVSIGYCAQAVSEIDLLVTSELWLRRKNIIY